MVLELENLRFGTELFKRGFAKMQKGGVIMDVTTPEQAIIAEQAGAVAVMALHAVPADIRKMGGVARMADPAIIEEIIEAVTIPVMAKARIGHYVEAQILEALGMDMVDESEVLTPADASLMIQLGADGVFVGSGIFKSEQPQAMAGAIVQAVHNFDNPQLLAHVSKGLGSAMKGLDASMIPEEEALQARGR
jgi:pyridoxal biosynthesis lyase PdxS